MSDKIDFEKAEEDGRHIAEEAKLRAETVSLERLQEAVEVLAAQVEELKDELPEIYRDEMRSEVAALGNGQPYIKVTFFTKTCYLSVVQSEIGKLTPAFKIGWLRPSDVISYADGHYHRDWLPADVLSVVRRTAEDGIVEIAKCGGMDAVRAERAAEEERLARQREEADVYEAVRISTPILALFAAFVILVVALVVLSSLG